MSTGGSFQADSRKGLRDYCFSQRGMLLVPIEHLSAEGISDELRQDIARRDALSDVALDWFDQAFKQYWERASELHQTVPRYWYPPRVQHACIVTEPKTIRPFFQPFNRNSWLLYASDFEPDTSSLELATYCFFHVERLSLVQQILPAQYLNLSYFRTLSRDQVTDFRAGCRRCDRPDAGAFRALGKAMEWIVRLPHETLAPARVAIPGAQLLQDSGLIVDRDSHQRLTALQQAGANAVNAVIKRYQGQYQSAPAHGGDDIASWLTQTKAQLVVTGAKGEMLWDTERPTQTLALVQALKPINREAACSILEDLKVVDQRTRQFLAAIKDKGALVDPAPHIGEGGLSYIHRERKLVAYPIGGEGNEHRLWEPAPPFERLMVGARTIHEWGHLAAESGWVRVREQRAVERQEIYDQLVDFFNQLHDRAAPGIKRIAAQEVAALTQRKGSLGQGLMHALSIRVEDYMSNLLAQRLLPADEMDTYVRNNVCGHAQDYTAAGVFMQLARLAYEYQYLALSRIPEPMNWFYSSTWIEELMFRPGVLTSTDFEELVGRVGDLCACFEIDQSRFKFED